MKSFCRIALLCCFSPYHSAFCKFTCCAHTLQWLFSKSSHLKMVSLFWSVTEVKLRGRSPPVRIISTPYIKRTHMHILKKHPHMDKGFTWWDGTALQHHEKWQRSVFSQYLRQRNDQRRSATAVTHWGGDNNAASLCTIENQSVQTFRAQLSAILFHKTP